MPRSARTYESNLVVVVTTTADAGGGSLRNAIQTINPYDGPGIINFDPSLSGQTILLTSGQLTVSNRVRIDASSLPGGITIHGNNSSRVLR